jgi:NhaA family Na+:H+ antiporter
LYPWVNFAILPIFALTNADVRFVGGGLGDVWADPALYGVFFGLLLGKPLGIMLFSLIATKFKIANLPSRTTWTHMLGAGILGGVGFTMAIFVANLAFYNSEVMTTAKLAILAASALAGIIGFLFLFVQAKRDEKNGIDYSSEDSSEEGLAREVESEQTI